MVIGIIAGLGTIILGIWTGIKAVASFVKDIALVVFDFFKSVLSWFVSTAPKPVQFIVFIFLILVFGNVITGTALGISYKCDNSILYEYTGIGQGVTAFVVGIMQDENINESNVCTATGDIEPYIYYPEELRFTYDNSNVSFSSECTDYCEFGGIFIKEFVCKEACVNITNNDGDIYRSCPTGLFNVNEYLQNYTVVASNINDRSSEIFQVDCSSSDSPRLKVFHIDWFSFELWIFILLLYIIYFLHNKF